MTTIAYRDGVIASDSLSTAGSHINSHVIKVIKHDGWLVGCAGFTYAGEEYREWFKKLDKTNWPCRFPKDLKAESTDEEPVEGLVISPKGVVWRIDGHGIPYRVMGKCHAIGSGRMAALGAMEMGASAVDAVKCAARWDTGTGGTIRKLSLDK